ncbi:phage head spike fiber domain-containing protein [Roseomonas marmotae]|uniref:CBM-cenC domain-containing protein n=1 Tax=Roseomonas marmotae TaxID=2768161 RepID=A0ABS3KBM6_9PROT|nr:hypothetical protein [Roseomonas marmotae]MBO1074874.1 hypothetical protein [Roseomonas marmotae]QTI80623.1 hypothetical protein IAI58_07815 [Roseomonas marmotae]
MRTLGPDHLGRATITRAGAALALDAGGIYRSLGADTPRFVGTDRRLLVEGAQTNLLRNPRAEGAIAGAPGTPPTYWSITPTAGMSREIGTGAGRGVPLLEVGCRGMPATSGYFSILLEPVGGIPCALGQVFTFAADIRLSAGSLPAGANYRIRLQERGGASSPATDQAFIPTGSWQRVAVTRTIGISGTTSIVPSILPYFVTEQGVTDMTLQMALPQVEIGPIATSPVLPASGSPAAGSRAADLPVWTPAGGLRDRGTVVVRAMLPQPAPFGASQGLWQIDDGTDQNRIQLRNTSAGSAITGVVEAAGATLATLSPGNMTRGVPFRAAFAWAPGSQALCITGGTVQTASAAIPAGLARMMIGHGSTQLNRAANGEVEWLDYYPSRLPDDLLQALANAA